MEVVVKLQGHRLLTNTGSKQFGSLAFLNLDSFALHDHPSPGIFLHLGGFEGTSEHTVTQTLPVTEASTDRPAATSAEPDSLASTSGTPKKSSTGRHAGRAQGIVGTFRAC